MRAGEPVTRTKDRELQRRKSQVAQDTGPAMDDLGIFPNHMDSSFRLQVAKLAKSIGTNV